MKNELIELIETRRSIRRFRPDPVPENLLGTVLEAGTYAPSGMGRQSPVIVAVENPETRERLTAMNARILGTTGDPYYRAPVILLVFAPEEWRNSVQDGSCVLLNLMLAAHALGLGSCWINREKEMFASGEGKTLMREWGLPEGLMGIGALALGYPEGEPPVPAERKKDYIFRVR